MHLSSKAAPLALLLLMACTSGAAGQEVPPGSQAAKPQMQPIDASFLEQYAETARFRAGRPNHIRITPRGEAILFLRSESRSFVNSLWSYDPSTGEEELLLTAEALLGGEEEVLSPEERARRERMRLASRGITSFQLSADGAKVLIPLSGALFLLERASGKVIELPSEGGFPIDPRFSPNGELVAVVRDGDLWVIELATKSQRRLTQSPGPHITNGLAEFVAQEEMDRYAGYWWSPDSEELVYQEVDTAGVETAYVADAINPMAKPHASPYPRPGKENVATRLGIISAKGGETKWISWDRGRYPYLATVRWSRGAPLTLLVQNRLQTEERLLAVSATGTTRTLLVEQDPAWINLDQSVPRWLPDGSAFLWSSERSGSWVLELRRRDGSLERELTSPELGYRSLVHVDRGGREAIVSASSNPTQTHLHRISLMAPVESELVAGPLPLTTDPGEHSATFAGDHSIYVHLLSSLAGELRFTVRDREGAPIGELRSVAETPSISTSLVLVELANEQAMRAALIRPKNFDARLRYPVVAYVYGGPLVRVVSAARERWLLQQWIADQGFVVVAIDGRGTPGRGRDWERSIHGNLIDLPLADQIAGLRSLGERFPELDMERVGVFGWSFGGYFASMAVMREPELFKAGVAVAPVAEWRDYDTHYTERYLDLPKSNAAGYEASSVLSYAAELRRPLLLIHGTSDDNVHFSQTLKISDALFRAGIHHEFLPLAGFTHMVPDPLVTTRLYTRIASFFQRELGPPLPASAP